MQKLANTVLASFFVLAAACGDPEVTRVTEDHDFDGTCVNCHTGLHAGQVHPTFKLRCVDCHGGNDQADIPENAAESADIYRSPGLIASAHVKPKLPELARFFWANGIDDDGDGEVDEAFLDTDGDGVIEAGESLGDRGEIAEWFLQGEGIGQFIDSELNRDLDYTRWLNPGDLRVASASCGQFSGAAGGGGCHQPVIDTVRRSIMASNGAVINGAYYGNQSWRATFQDARDDTGPAPDPRKGAFGFIFAWDEIDACITAPAAGDDRAQPSFDSTCLEAQAAALDPGAAAGASGNDGLPAFEATQGTVPALDLQGNTIEHTGVFRTRYPWGGNALADPNASLAEIEPIPNEELLPGLPDPVDTVLRGFRAYYPLNFPGSSINGNLSFGESIKPGIDQFRFNNPFGRGHSSGCTGCHMSYARDGRRQPQRVPQIAEDGSIQLVTVEDPTTKHREFDPATQDIVSIAGQDRLVGMTVNLAERIFATEGDPAARPQQRFYSESHTLTTAITTDTCGLCHSFVTRIDHSYRGFAEDEQRDAYARQAPIQFVTQTGTQVAIHDSQVREEIIGGVPTILPDRASSVGLATIEAAKQRDSMLAAMGFHPAMGGCVPDVFTEDCNNNGQLDTELVLTALGPGGVPISTTINEDLNGNGVLDLIDRVPRERSVDGRQFKYIYGGENGAVRLMDIHFEKGMHCIDCHFLQDTHGDGHIYTTNWEQIELECEDCHGTLGAGATLVTSGANGGNDLTRAVDHDGIPYFVRLPDGTVFQRSRVTKGLAWRVPQVPDVVDPGSPDFNARAAAAMTIPGHMPDPVPAGERTTGSTFDANGKLTNAKLECYSCHNAWIYNCMGCHFQLNQGDDVRLSMAADGSITTVPGENEVWFNNTQQFAKTDFQLLEFQRGPFVLGVNATADGHRLAPFRSSMQAHASLTDADGNAVLDNVTFTTFQAKDANSGRANVATSGAAMNQTMPHTVRISETKDCDWCHSVVDQQGRITNEHILGQTYGLGVGRYPYTGDWIFAAGPSGLELYEIKQENQNKGSTGSNRFPGIIMQPGNAGRVAADVEPLLDGSGGITAAAFDASDVAFIRNFNPEPAAAGGTAPPTLRDLALFTLEGGANGRLVIADVTARGHPTAARPSVGDADVVFVLNLDGPGKAMATLSPDLSDPFVYVAQGAAGIGVVRLQAAPGPGVTAATLEFSSNVGLGGETATALALAGDVLYVGTAEGSVHVFDLSTPDAPVKTNAVNMGGAVQALQVTGFMLWVGTDAGLGALDLDDPLDPRLAVGAVSAIVLPGLDVQGLYVSAGHAYLAAGTDGVVDVDVTVPAAPVDLGDVTPVAENVDARDVVVSKVPGQTWLVIADASAGGGLSFFKLDSTENSKERCFPNPLAAECGKDMDFRDPTITGRDPSFDPAIGALVPAGQDPSSLPFQRQTQTIAGVPRRLARPAQWEQLGTLSGRRLRDSFMPGSGVLSLEVMQRMRRVELCVADGADPDANGLGPLGFADATFKSTGVCTPMAP